MSINRITYCAPKDKFERISANVISKFDAIIVGAYCKIVRLSQGKSLNVDWCAKKIGINKDRMRKIIVLLESEGYITRTPLKDDKGRMNGWHYQVFAEPIAKDKRTHAGVKSVLSENRVDGSPCYGKSDNTENGEDNISNNIKYINTDNNINTEKVLSNDNTKNPHSDDLSDEEKRYVDKMREMFPRIMRMEQPLTLEQAKKLKAKFDEDLLLKVMHEMENWKPLIKNKVSAYMTINNWCNRENDKL